MPAAESDVTRDQLRQRTEAAVECQRFIEGSGDAPIRQHVGHAIAIHLEAEEHSIGQRRRCAELHRDILKERRIFDRRARAHHGEHPRNE